MSGKCSAWLSRLRHCSLRRNPPNPLLFGEIAEQLPPEVHADLAHLEKRMRIERSGDVNIDSLLLAHMAAEENFREDYARFPLANMGADRNRALEVNRACD